MKEELEVALVDVINTIAQAKDFVLAETPDIIQQLLIYKVYECWLNIGVCTFFILATILVVAITIKQYKKWEVNHHFLTFAGPIASLILLVFACVGVICLIENVLKLIQINIAPKVFLIEYAAKLAG